MPFGRVEKVNKYYTTTICILIPLKIYFITRGWDRVNAPVNEHLRLVNEHYYKIIFAARLIPRVAKIVWI